MKCVLLTLFLWPSVLVSAEPLIDGPEQAATGEFVTLRTAPENLEAVLCRWVAVGLEANEFSVDSDGRQLCFATRRPGRYCFVLLVVSENPLAVSEARHIVTIHGGEPAPDDPLAAWVRTQLMPMPAEALDCRAALALAFRQVATLIEKNDLREVREISLATRGATQAAVPERFAELWKQSFFAPLGKKLSELKLQGAPAHAAAWRSIARGLEGDQP